MTPAANVALPQTVTDTGRSVARAAAALLPSRPRVREDGLERDDEVAPGVDLDAFHRGDFATFRTVLHHFGPLIQSIAARYTLNAHDREELYQEITLHMWKRRTQYSARGPLGGWINRVTHHFCRNWKSAQAAREAIEERHATEVIALGEADAVLEDPSKLMERTEFMDSLRLALAQLPPKQERAFTLVHVMGYSASEAARKLETRPATVRSNLRHAARKLRHRMKDYRT